MKSPFQPEPPSIELLEEEAKGAAKDLGMLIACLDIPDEEKMLVGELASRQLRTYNLVALAKFTVAVHEIRRQYRKKRRKRKATK